MLPKPSLYPRSSQTAKTTTFFQTRARRPNRLTTRARRSLRRSLGRASLHLMRIAVPTWKTPLGDASPVPSRAHLTSRTCSLLLLPLVGEALPRASILVPPAKDPCPLSPPRTGFHLVCARPLAWLPRLRRRALSRFQRPLPHRHPQSPSASSSPGQVTERRRSSSTASPVTAPSRERPSPTSAATGRPSRTCSLKR